MRCNYKNHKNQPYSQNSQIYFQVFLIDCVKDFHMWVLTVSCPPCNIKWQIQGWWNEELMRLSKYENQMNSQYWWCPSFTSLLLIVLVSSTYFFFFILNKPRYSKRPIKPQFCSKNLILQVVSPTATSFILAWFLKETMVIHLCCSYRSTPIYTTFS